MMLFATAREEKSIKNHGNLEIDAFCDGPRRKKHQKPRKPLNLMLFTTDKEEKSIKNHGVHGF